MEMPKVRELAISDIEPNAWNPNEMGDRDFERLKAEIAENGFIDPIEVVPIEDEKYRIIGGEHRFTAVKELGGETITAVVLGGDRWNDEDLQKFVTVRLNVLHGKINPGRMVALYDEMASKYGEEQLQQLFAYTDKSGWDDMLKTIQRGLVKAGVDKDKINEFKDKAKDAVTIEELGVILNELFAKYGDTVSQNFMVFTYGKKKHVYIACAQPVWRKVSRLLKYATESGRDINEFFGDALDKALESAKAAAKEAKAKPAEKQDDVPF